MKTKLLLIALAITTATTAQSVEEFTADFERQKALTLAYIEAMPADKFDYRPNEDVRTFAQQLLHAAQGTFNISSNGTGGERMYAETNLEKEAPFQTKEEVKRLVSESFDYAINGIKSMDASTFDEVVERGPFKVTRRGWLNKALEHVSHHRGQCAVYLRLSGVEPPRYKLF